MAVVWQTIRRTRFLAALRRRTPVIETTFGFLSGEPVSYSERGEPEYHAYLSRSGYYEATKPMSVRVFTRLGAESDPRQIDMGHWPFTPDEVMIAWRRRQQ